MCAVARLWAGISRIAYGAGRNDVNAVYFESRHANTIDFIRDAYGKTDPGLEPTKQPA
jgi:tRNA(adenine34) deaminase